MVIPGSQHSKFLPLIFFRGQIYFFLTKKWVQIKIVVWFRDVAWNSKSRWIFNRVLKPETCQFPKVTFTRGILTHWMHLSCKCGDHARLVLRCDVSVIKGKISKVSFSFFSSIEICRTEICSCQGSQQCNVVHESQSCRQFNWAEGRSCW